MAAQNLALSRTLNAVSDLGYMFMTTPLSFAFSFVLKLIKMVPTQLIHYHLIVLTLWSHRLFSVNLIFLMNEKFSIKGFEAKLYSPIFIEFI